MHARKHRAGLRLPIAGVDVDAARQRGPHQRARHGGAAHHHLQLGEIDIVAPRRREQHLQDRRHAMRGRHALARDQSQQDVRRIPPRVDLLAAHHGVQVRAPPCVDMKHRGQRHIDVVAVNPSLAWRAAIFCGDGEGVQHQLTVAEIHPLRPAGGACSVEPRGAGVLVEVGKLEERRIRRQHFLIFAFDRQTRRRLLLAVVKQHEFRLRRELVGELLDQRQKVGVYQHGRGGRVVHREQQRLRRQREIDRVQRRAHHRHGEIALLVAVAVSNT